MQSILATNVSPAVDNTTAYGALYWNETVDKATNTSKLDWQIIISVNPSTNYRTLVAKNNILSIGPYSYNLTSNKRCYNRDILISGSTTISHSNYSSTVPVSMSLNVGGDIVSASAYAPLTYIDVDPIDIPTVDYPNGQNTPVLFSKDTTDFSTNGIGRLTGCLSCTVTEELNGSYELEMTISTVSPFFNSLEIGSIIGVTPFKGASRQAFQIYEISKKINNTAQVRAEHISYRLSYIPVKGPITANGASATLAALKTNAVYENCPFTFSTDVTENNDKTYKLVYPASLRSQLSDEEGCVLDLFGGEYLWDNFHVYLLQNRGQDRGVTLRYGKNLTDLDAKQSLEGFVSGYLPYWTDNAKDNPQVVIGQVQYTDWKDAYGYHKTEVLDLTSYFDTKPTAAQLNSKVAELITDAGDELNLQERLTLSFVDLTKCVDYKDIKVVETITLGDTVHIVHQDIRVSYSAKVIKLVFNVLEDKIDEIELGDPEDTFIDMYTSSTTEIQRITNEQKVLEDTTNTIVIRVEESIETMENTAAAAQNAADQARQEAEAARQEAEKAGQAIVRDTLYYLVSDKYSGVTDTDYGWTSTIQTMTPEKPYLWTYHYYERANLTGYNSAPIITGVYGLQGPPGATIAKFEMIHMRSDSTTIPDKPVVEVTEQGLDISNVWSLNTPKWNKAYPYYYICSQILFTDGSYSWSQPLADTATEEMLRNAIVSITNQYYTSTSDEELTGGDGWYDNYNEAILKMATEASKEEGGRDYYIWIRQVTTKADDSVIYGEPYYDSSLTTTTEQSARLNVMVGSISSEVTAVTTVVNADHEMVVNNNTAITQLPDKISQSVISTLTGEDGEITKTNNRIQTAEETIDTITTTYPDEIKAAKDDASSALNKAKTLETYIKHTSRGVEVSDSQSPSTGVFGPSSLDYYINNSVVASFGTEKTIVANELDIGVADSNGWRVIGKGAHLTFTRRQG